MDQTRLMVIARVCHEAMSVYRRALGEKPLPPWDEAEGWQVESTLAAIRFRIANPDVPPGAQHQQWLEEKAGAGWRYGPTRDDEKKIHPMMVPFEALPESEKRKDVLIQRVIDAFLEDV
ncbi:RyR domain-containing protein [Glycocaulis sp.]